MIHESSLWTVEIGFWLLSIMYQIGKKKRRKGGRGRRERENSNQMGEMGFADTRTERMIFFAFLRKKDKKKGVVIYLFIFLLIGLILLWTYYIEALF